MRVRIEAHRAGRGPNWLTIEEPLELAKALAAHGGEVLDRKGYFIQPTIVRDIPDNARLVKEEQFGPIVPVLRYSDLDDAIARANDSEYGLGGTVWGKDLDRAFRVAARIESGIVWINRFLDVSPDVPLGGAKQSGIGAELGQEGLEAYTQLKIINMAK